MESSMASMVFETATNTYTSNGSVGDGGCGTVFQVTDVDGATFALKLLRDTNTNKRKRFRNELEFCRRNLHDRIIKVVDEGVYSDGAKHLPFYVMPLFASTLRRFMQAGIAQDQVLRVFNDILDGVEAAHLQGVIHRDLKPENLLVTTGQRIVVADFGIAHFREEDLFSALETRAGYKLANYRYAAPEQLSPREKVDGRADIFALGYILNEIFTGDVPHGAGHRRIGEVAPDYAYLDPLVDSMIQQSPLNRPASIGKIKEELIGRGMEGHDVQVLGYGGYADGVLRLRLSAAPPPDWISLVQSGEFAYSSMGGPNPKSVVFQGDQALLRIKESAARQTFGHFKAWVETVNQEYRSRRRQREAERIRKEIKKAEEEALTAETLKTITFRYGR
jgi:serine/threonine protein kinase